MQKVKPVEDLDIPGPRHRDGTSAADPKNQAKIEPLYAPELYARHFDGKENRIAIGMRDGSQRTYDFHKRIDDPSSSFAATVMLDKTSGHAIIMYKGMDLPGRNEGSGRTGFLKDYETARAASQGHDNAQTGAAEKVYLDTLQDPDVKSLEIVGYSIGSLHLNYMAAKYGAKGTTIADMGIPDQVLSSVYNKAAGSSQPLHSLDEMNAGMRDRVTSLKKEWDFIPASHAASPPRGQVLTLDRGNWSMFLGIAHIPQVYRADAEGILKERRIIPVSGATPGI